jgi:hypothetical protein
VTPAHVAVSLLRSSVQVPVDDKDSADNRLTVAVDVVDT